MVPRAAALLALAALAGCNSLRLQDAQPPKPDEWAASGGTPARPNAAAFALAPPFRQDWCTNVDAAFGPGSATVADGVVFVGTRRGEVLALRLDDGRRLGVVELGETVEGGVAREAGGFVAVVGSGKRRVVRFDLRGGKTDWAVERGASVEAPPLVDGAVVVTADARGALAGIDLASGRDRWRRESPTRTSVLAAPARTPAGVFAVDAGGSARVLDPATGVDRWARPLGFPVRATPAALGEAVFVPTTRGVLLALDAATGAERWRFSAGADSTVRLTAPAVDAAALAVGATDGTVRLLDPVTGALRWTFTTDGAVTAAPLLLPTVVLVGTMRKTLVALDRATGAVVWEHELAGRVKSAFAAHAGGVVVLAEPRFVYHFVPAADAVTARR